MEILPLGDKKGKNAACDFVQRIFLARNPPNSRGEKKKLKSPYLHHRFLHVVSIYSRVSKNIYFSLNL
jgi:hypothetical protein